MIQYGDSILIMLEHEEAKYFSEVKRGSVLKTHYGNLIMDSLVGREFGEKIRLGLRDAFLIKPSMIDGIFSLKRSTQIVYPKDVAFILLYLDIKPGDVVYEAGTGTGVMTSAFSRAVCESGKVVSYEKRQDFLEKAQKNVRHLGHIERVTFVSGDVAECKESQKADAFFLDVPEPSASLESAVSILKRSGRICILCPTANQVQETVTILGTLGIIDIQVWEILARSYKANPERFRPEDRMVGHTTYLVFGIKVEGRKLNGKE
ncbi:SAM-dependent methyltransferase [Mesotoga sp. HF07.pep.5.2.highcov]|jgi:tRNA (adenine57-N1/adenine58-N1)-methyltransferase|uniref:tRNA (adenine-N1)-methyltransferase n=1 Tax=Mesotoga TaxID=1184396 RepID=UPI0002CB08CF|nr:MULTISPECIES: tRNA (adenine-N1)-methyltransferase [unclassified Mesotoga]MCP5460377.1 tRNA (adenine-N1)-methyltransferase [Thermotogota bacterium]CCU83818.1 Protein-L-isoaspartate(D-aspartate) O-methyltransferase [Mesotoga infera]MDK2943536.1 tRNA (adenine57-N1/adenine58-N1)-methyltransferase catalytic subunit [Mesotoga sp.]RLL90149.1 SAM-dependent methyltransferase [Mesotoga sp. HF07.pep.5.2.highcov]HRX65256.1 tRNA (adenine-N1)-methyltransferase [Mesotoga sp.]